ncbi:pteridine reductase [Fulvimonas soli]|uniref:Pteridine reductase n=1 Tax=Fulvimonas soli TaxID=155197 RepID=A0A316HVD5_9GAMM|nr:pteridine reductase [Fulvimonas soli]PWK83882.1 pteridine reductase [Fulvimonas soli]TNY25045.1 pteridine reductase [Fulvimonas soli]
MSNESDPKPRGERPVALVTGAAKRIGASIARTLHAAGYDLALHCRRSLEEAHALAAELERQRAGSARVLQAELTDTAALARLVAEAVAGFGRLDALVNNASTYYATPFAQATAQQWDDLLGANARAPFFLCQAAAPHLRARRGAVVNIADIYAERPLPGYPLYSISKAAVVMLTKALAVELGPEVRVNAIAPGNMLWSTNAVKAETEATVRERTALARQGSPQDVADAVLFLLRDARYSSGVVLPTDGGRLLHI